MKLFTKTYWCAPLIGMHWLKSQTLCHKQDYESSLKRLLTIERLTSRDAQPMGGIYAEYASLRGHVYYGLGDTDKAIAELQSGIRAAKHSSNYNDEEKDYIQAYASIEHPDLVPPLKEVSVGMVEDIRLGDVRMDIKLCLPLFSHPRWPHPDQIGLELDENGDVIPSEPE